MSLSSSSSFYPYSNLSNISYHSLPSCHFGRSCRLGRERCSFFHSSFPCKFGINCRNLYCNFIHSSHINNPLLIKKKRIRKPVLVVCELCESNQKSGSSYINHLTTKCIANTLLRRAPFKINFFTNINATITHFKFKRSEIKIWWCLKYKKGENDEGFHIFISPSHALRTALEKFILKCPTQSYVL